MILRHYIALLRESPTGRSHRKKYNKTLVTTCTTSNRARDFALNYAIIRTCRKCARQTQVSTFYHYVICILQ